MPSARFDLHDVRDIDLDYPWTSDGEGDNMTNSASENEGDVDLSDSPIGEETEETVTQFSMSPDPNLSESDNANDADLDDDPNLYSPMEPGDTYDDNGDAETGDHHPIVYSSIEPRESSEHAVDANNDDSGPQTRLPSPHRRPPPSPSRCPPPSPPRCHPLSYPQALGPRVPWRESQILWSSSETLRDTSQKTKVQFKAHNVTDIESDEDMFESVKKDKKRPTDGDEGAPESKKFKSNSCPFSELVTIYVKEKTSLKKLVASLSLLSGSSNKIRNAITPNEESRRPDLLHAKAAGDHHLMLLKEEGNTVANFLAWLYRGKVVAAGSMTDKQGEATSMSDDDLRKLFLFGSEYDITGLMEGVLNATVVKWKNGSQTHQQMIDWYIFSLDYDVADFQKAILHSLLKSWKPDWAFDSRSIGELWGELDHRMDKFFEDPAWKLIINLCVMSNYYFTLPDENGGTRSWPWDLSQGPLTFVCSLLDRVGGPVGKRGQKQRILAAGSAGDCAFLGHEKCGLDEGIAATLGQGN